MSDPFIHYVREPNTNNRMLRHSEFACRPQGLSVRTCENGWVPARREQVGAIWQCDSCNRYWLCVWTGFAYWQPISNRRARREMRKGPR